MKKGKSKQVLIGTAGLLVSSFLFALTILLDVRSFSIWLMGGMMAVSFGGFLGSLFFMFSGLEGLINGFLYGAGFVGFIVASKELPRWLFGLLILFAVAFFICRPLIHEYQKDRQKNSKTVLDPRLDEEIRREEAEEQGLEDETNELRKSVRLGEKSLLLLTKFNGFYQMIKGSDRFFLVHVGSELGGINAELLKADFTQESGYCGGKKDYEIEFNKITSVSYSSRRAIGTQLDNCGNIILKTAEKRYAFTVLDSLPLRQLKSFFRGLPFTVKDHVKTKTVSRARELNEEEKLLLPKLKKACLAMMVGSFLCGAAFLFLPLDNYQYYILSAICILLPPLAFGLYIKYQNLLSLDEKSGGGSSHFKKTSSQIMTPLLIPSCVLVLRTMLDFTVTDIPTLLIWSGALFVTAMALFLGLTKEYRRSKGIIAFMVLVLLAYCPSAVVQINCLYDYSEPEVYATSLVDKRISTGSKSPDKYYFTVHPPEGGDLEIMVSEGFYDLKLIGDKVIVYDNLGLFGIDYVFIDESEDE